MRFTNAEIFVKDGFRRGGFTVEDGRFAKIDCSEDRGEGTDLGSARVIPGLVDIHIHGSSGADFSDGDAAGLEAMAAYLARCGVTAFAPTSLSLSYERLAAAFATAAELRERAPSGCARVVGVHMEGPFFAAEKKGAQNADHLKLPDADAFERLYRGCGGLIRIVDAAPELPGAAEFARRASALCVVSAAHTAASYEQADAFFASGAKHVAHLFNAMTPFHHRKPGVIGAAAEREDVTAELICDGLHVHPSAVRMAFRLFPGRLCLISDALRCCGMADGTYELGGQSVYLKGGVARLADGTIAGAAANLFDGMRNAIAFGVPIAEAIRAASSTPARVVGQDAEIGSIEVGKRADFIVCDGQFHRKAVYLGGKKLSP